MRSVTLEVPVSEFTPVVAPRSKVVHAVAFVRPLRTQCGKRFAGGWRVALEKVTCEDCQLALVLDARPKKKKGKRKVVR